MSAEQRYRDTLARAEKRDPGNAFVASCRRHFEAHGFLSPRQEGALNRVTRTRRMGRLDLAGPPNSWSASGDYDDFGLAQPFDWAGGD